MGVAQVGRAQLLGRPGELGQHEGASAVVAGGDVLLGHEVHPVPQRGDEHDVGHLEEGGHLLARVGLVQVVDRGVAQVREVAVDPAHGRLDLLAERAVGLDPLAAGGGDLDEGDVRGSDVAVLEQLADRAQPVPDALGVVEPVDPHEHDVGVAERLPDLAGPLTDLGGVGQALEAGGIDRDRDRGGPHGPRPGARPPVVGAVPAHLVAGGAGPEHRPAGAPEVAGVVGALEAQEVGPEQAAQDRGPPRELGEELDRREGDVVEPADPQVGSTVADHRRDQLELVVVHPHGRALGGHLADRLGEPFVDRAVAVPPGPVEGGRDDDVVVERPQGVVGEALVVVGDLLGRQRHRDQPQRPVVEGFGGLAGEACPADPGALPVAHDRLHGGDQASGAGLPGRGAVRFDVPVHRQPVGGHDEVVGAACGRNHLRSSFVDLCRLRPPA